MNPDEYIHYEEVDEAVGAIEEEIQDVKAELEGFTICAGQKQQYLEGLKFARRQLADIA